MKIPCGGFYIDENTLEVNDNVLKVKNGGSGSDIFHITKAGLTLDKTWQEVVDAMLSKKLCLVWDNGENESFMYVVYQAFESRGTYYVRVNSGEEAVDYTTKSADGYPEVEIG